MTYNEFKAKLEEVNQIKDYLKARSMIFQVDAKERAAALCDLPFDTFYHLPYAEWNSIDRQLMAFRLVAENSFDMDRKKIKEFKGMNGKTELGRIWLAYKKFCQRVGLENAPDLIKAKFIDKKPKKSKLI